MPLQATSGAASYDAFGGNGVAVVPNYIEDVFSTWLYAGTGSSNTIVNGIDLSTNGGMVWIKGRDIANNNALFDTNRGVDKYLISDGDNSQAIGGGDGLPAFNTNGFRVGASNLTNRSGFNFASWTFRKQPKFFDVVTWTGDGANRTIAHALGSVPACIMVKRTDTTGNWQVYHRSLANTEYLVLNSTAAKATGATRWNSTTPTSTVFSLGTDATVNASGGTYVAYIFAHDAGGFGLTGTDNVISCGSVVGASQVEVNLGWEPQWILVKNASAAQDWWLVDNMRGLPVQAPDTSYNASNLRPNLSDAETTGFAIAPSATGFKANVLTASQTYIYIAIRRGPMKVPTLGTTVYNAISRTGTGAVANVTGVGFPPDFNLSKRFNGTGQFYELDRLRGATKILDTADTAAETTDANSITSFDMDGVTWGNASANNAGLETINWYFKRAPSFFDEVCYTGTGATAQNLTHNLGVAPELMIVKVRDETARSWTVYSGNAGQYLLLNTTDAVTSNANVWNNTAPTSSVFSVGNFGTTNSSGKQIVAYLFATCAGVSKVGSYTGTGTTQTINCGFTAGARWIMIKRTDSTGDWYVWDSTRGIIAGNDPYLLLNSTSGQVTGTDYVDTAATGFELSSTAPAAINANGGTYIFLAIA